jgi:hypothetical protein
VSKVAQISHLWNYLNEPPLYYQCMLTQKQTHVTAEIIIAKLDKSGRRRGQHIHSEELFMLSVSQIYLDFYSTSRLSRSWAW